MSEACVLDGANLQVVSGHFDPLLALHAERLEQIKRAGTRLVVVLTDPAEPILPQRARAELVAALSSVDLVVMGEPEGLKPEVRFEDEDARSSAAFVAHILERMS